MASRKTAFRENNVAHLCVFLFLNVTVMWQSAFEINYSFLTHILKYCIENG